MKTKNILEKGLFTLVLLLANIVLAQTSISGTVVDAENQEAIPGANIIVVGSNTGAVADFNGNFTLNTSADFPLMLQVSYIGYGSQTVEVLSADELISVELAFGQNLNEVVISASRRSEKILDAPASISIITSQDLENTANVNGLPLWPDFCLISFIFEKVSYVFLIPLRPIPKEKKSLKPYFKSYLTTAWSVPKRS